MELTFTKAATSAVLLIVESLRWVSDSPLHATCNDRVSRNLMFYANVLFETEGDLSDGNGRFSDPSV